MGNDADHTDEHARSVGGTRMHHNADKLTPELSLWNEGNGISRGNEPHASHGTITPSDMTGWPIPFAVANGWGPDEAPLGLSG